MNRDPLNAPNIRDEADFFILYAPSGAGDILRVTISRPDRDREDRTYIRDRMTNATLRRLERLADLTWNTRAMTPQGWLGLSTR